MEWKAKTAKTRQAWLDELGRRLVWFFPADQVRDIVSDYREQFEAGHDHCRTEAEIIQALGTPAEAAALLLEEEPSARGSCLRHSVIWGAVLAVCVAFLWIALNAYSFSFLWSGISLFFFSSALALFQLLKCSDRISLERQTAPEKHVSPVQVYAVPAAMILACTVESWLPFGMAATWVLSLLHRKYRRKPLISPPAPYGMGTRCS